MLSGLGLAGQESMAALRAVGILYRPGGRPREPQQQVGRVLGGVAGNGVAEAIRRMHPGAASGPAALFLQAPRGSLCVGE